MFHLHLTIQNEFDIKTDAETLEACILKVAQKSDIAFAKLYKLTSDAVYGFALSVLINTHDAEDVLQDCFINIYNAAPSYRPDGKPMAWILTITKSLCYQRLRKNSKISDIPENTVPATVSSSKNNISKDKAKEIALTHAGLSANDVKGYFCEADRENGVSYYEIEFKANGYEYSYEINASTGKIVASEKEKGD